MMADAIRSPERLLMRVISKSRLRAFWELPGCAEAMGPLRAWHSHVAHRAVAWRSWADVKGFYGNARLVGNCVVFNIGGNKFRLVTRILYSSQKVFILKVMTHREYDEGRWKSECGCFDAPPARSPGTASRRPAEGKGRG
jgi:mRNA interferase HigB